MKFKKNGLLSLLLCMAMVLATVVNPTVASAADEDVKYVSYDNVAETYRGDEITYPQDQAGYVFAGWYSKSGEEYLPMSETTADQASTAYGKFVKSNVLGLKFQVTAGTTALSESTSIRVLTAVDDLYYQEVGFEATGDMTENYTSTTVYSKINAGGNTYEADEVFGVPAEYFMTFTGTLPQANFANNLTFRPMWVTLDGTTVYGAAKSVKVKNNVPDGTFEILDFENLEDVHNVAGNGQVASLSRVAYADAGITADATTYGNYALQAVPSNKWPAFTIKLGRTYDTDVKLNFSAYLDLDEAYIVQDYYPIENTEGTNLGGANFNKWDGFTLTIPANTSEYTFRFNFQLGGRVSDCTKVTIYLDNIKLVAPVTTLDFETALDAEYVAGNGQVASLSRVAYADTDITADATTYGNYALQAVPSKKWPAFTIKLGRTYDTDVKLNFSAYLDLDEAYIVQNYYPIETTGGTNLAGGNFNKWVAFGLTIPAGTSEYTFRFNFDLGGRITDCTKVTIYFDNIKLVAPVTKLSFESAGDTEYVVGNGQVASLSRVAYDDTDITADATTYGNYALQAVPSKKWPAFTIKLGRTYETDVTLNFSAYLDLDAAYIVQNYYPIENTSGTNLAGGNFNKWVAFGLTIPAGTSEYTFRFNFDLGGRISDCTKVTIYFDNFNVVTP